jgi:hypothetical protein
VTKDEVVPNGLNPVAPPNLREPDVPMHRHHCSEVERLADAARPPLAQEKRRLRTAIGMAMNGHHDSVGVVEIEEKTTINARSTHIVKRCWPLRTPISIMNHRTSVKQNRDLIG